MTKRGYLAQAIRVPRGIGALAIRPPLAGPGARARLAAQRDSGTAHANGNDGSGGDSGMDVARMGTGSGPRPCPRPIRHRGPGNAAPASHRRGTVDRCAAHRARRREHEQRLYRRCLCRADREARPRRAAAALRARRRAGPWRDRRGTDEQCRSGAVPGQERRPWPRLPVHSRPARGSRGAQAL